VSDPVELDDAEEDENLSGYGEGRLDERRAFLVAKRFHGSHPLVWKFVSPVEPGFGNKLWGAAFAVAAGR